jgi:2-polyprenyl-3-methyl-5-hydroxy-6-metoxy-1,4-benzoquinol methylase
LRIMNENNGFHFVRHDVRTQTKESYDLIRVMNVLNHLDRDDQIRALQACFNSLRDNGYLVVGRTLGGEMPTSIWMRHGNELRLLLDIAGGSEISHLIGQAVNDHSNSSRA